MPETSGWVCGRGGAWHQPPTTVQADPSHSSIRLRRADPSCAPPTAKHPLVETQATPLSQSVGLTSGAETTDQVLPFHRSVRVLLADTGPRLLAIFPTAMHLVGVTHPAPTSTPPPRMLGDPISDQLDPSQRSMTGWRPLVKPSIPPTAMQNEVDWQAAAFNSAPGSDPTWGAIARDHLFPDHSSVTAALPPAPSFPTAKQSVIPSQPTSVNWLPMKPSSGRVTICHVWPSHLSMSICWFASADAAPSPAATQKVWVAQLTPTRLPPPGGDGTLTELQLAPFQRSPRGTSGIRPLDAQGGDVVGHAVPTAKQVLVSTQLTPERYWPMDAGGTVTSDQPEPLHRSICARIALPSPMEPAAKHTVALAQAIELRDAPGTPSVEIAVGDAEVVEGDGVAALEELVDTAETVARGEPVPAAHPLAATDTASAAAAPTQRGMVSIAGYNPIAS